MTASPTRSPRVVAVGSVLATALLGGCADNGGDALVARGRQIYLAQCIQCHNANPAIPGPVGPAVKGASRELLEAKIIRGEYPPGYTPKRPTKVMPPQPTLAPDIPALAAYLK
jgi:mono/diheme cytochrome c family protein